MNLNNYEDIIDKQHEIKYHPRMSRYNRAAQFAPFAALTGYEDKIKEASRITNKYVELDDALLECINKKLNLINDVIKTNPEVEITYFIPDRKKDGGEYISIKGKLKRIDFINRFLKFINGEIVVIDNVIEVKSDITDGLNLL